MALRQEVRDLVALGPLPDEQSAEVEELRAYEALLSRIARPVSDDEAEALIGLFGKDGSSCYGFAWTMLHLIESAPHWPLEECLQGDDNEWVALLRLRVENGRKFRGHNSLGSG